MPCPGLEELESFLRESDPAARDTNTARHLLGCERCQRLLDEVQENQSFALNHGIHRSGKTAKGPRPIGPGRSRELTSDPGEGTAREAP